MLRSLSVSAMNDLNQNSASNNGNNKNCNIDNGNGSNNDCKPVNVVGKTKGRKTQEVTKERGQTDQ